MVTFIYDSNNNDTNFISITVASDPNIYQQKERIDPEFIVTANTRTVTATRGMEVEGILMADDCKQQCVNSKTTCFGFEFRRNPPACFLMTSPHYVLDVIGAAAGFVNYRRRLLTKGIFKIFFVLFSKIFLIYVNIS